MNSIHVGGQNVSVGTGPALSEIKIGRKLIPIRKGDYIQFNESLYLLIAGDMRIFYTSGLDHYSHIEIPKSRLKQIPFEKMKQKTVQSKLGVKLTKYYF